MSIGTSIVDWYGNHGRDLPWRKTRDPYQIWISEIILQQTRIAQGIDYYHRFIHRFPDVHSLAAAQQDEVLKYWEGLGYYSRARNLHFTAQFVVNELNGEFPDHYTELLKLKGIGPYTARAIGSFAFGNQTGVIDGNVLRVMSRVLGDFSPIDVLATRKHFQKIIDQWIAQVDPALFNQGIMDIGSTVCTPTQPGCLICPLEPYCEGRKQGITHLLPQKAKKLKRQVRYLNFYLIRNGAEELIVRQRPEKGIWGGLWEIPNREVDEVLWRAKGDDLGGLYMGEMKHVLTHLDLMIHVFQLEAEQIPAWTEGQFIPTKKISILAFAKAVLKIFDRML
jgi:A/G-specific adenine glycosylase